MQGGSKSYNPVSEVILHHICNILIVTGSRPHSRGGESQKHKFQEVGSLHLDSYSILCPPVIDIPFTCKIHSSFPRSESLVPVQYCLFPESQIQAPQV